MIENQEGITLIELLLVLALSSMVLTLGASFLITMSKASDRTLGETNLRNESVLVIDALNKTMENADELVIEDNDNNDSGLNLVNVIEIEMIEDPINSGSFIEQRFPLQIKIESGNLYINNRKVNGDQFSLESTLFFIKDKQLICKIIIQDKHTPSKPYEILKIYDLAE
ncbi:prepilin-type N-terminal cleavage/methylation domain-containing protein [Metabacillus idriensis]|uniref:prepilin-type N-terminal cleavage/methylation domain-containing protein n=1 Tax=Metabacillus idriensis TaxID=324768 RepID=UPI001749807F|nr:prepilin-type N-terminal cleavage/methylation domain-containing protein [Metabacillus idriensis]